MNDTFPPTGNSNEHLRLEMAAATATPTNGPLPTYGYGSNILTPNEVHLLDYVKVLYKWRRVAMSVFFTIFVAVTVYTFTQTPIYEARTQLLIENEHPNIVSFKEAIDQEKATLDYYQTQYRILQSRSLARRTLTALNLWTHPQFSPPKAAPNPIKGAINSATDRVKAVFETAPPRKDDGPEAQETAGESRTIDHFLADLSIVPIRNSRLVDVKFQSADPSLAAQAANALARGYIEQSLEYKYTSSKEASDWLGERLAEQRKQVESSEQALQRYREQTDAVSLEERQNIVVQKLADLNSAVTRAKTERIQKESAYNQIRAVQNDPNALDTVPAILSNSFIQQQKTEIADLQRQQGQLAEKLGPNHPDMRKLTNSVQLAEAKLRGEIAKVVQSMRNDYQAAVSQEQSLIGALEQQKHEALALNRKQIDYGVLQRDAATNRQIFDSLLQRTKETGISGELKTTNIRVVDPAETPRAPAYPNRTNNELLALFGGLLVSVGLAFFFEYMDSHIKTPDEIKTHLGIPYLGLVPALDESNRSPMINNGVPASFAEAFRSVRTNILFSSTQEGGKSLVVTSTGPGEGKTVVSTNLAMALAQAGQRVLLVDADMRKPRVHTMFQYAQEPGLSNVLVGTSKASDAVKNSDVAGLWVLPAGAHPPNPAELLGSKRFADFIRSLAEHFDWVVIDTPPVMAVTDSSVAAHRASAVVFVVGSEMTSRHSATRAIEQLVNAKSRIAGAVLNRVDLKHNAYYYSQYYRREYGAYYTRTAS